ncbi:MAG: Ig-like domain-containing protein [Verrucomicrobia bacterium]|nr:Ig-like domain-containing protein [Prolixibacteraceae bacterium]
MGKFFTQFFSLMLLLVTFCFPKYGIANGDVVGYVNPNNLQDLIALPPAALLTLEYTATDAKCMGDSGLISIVAKEDGVESSSVLYSFDNGVSWENISKKTVPAGTYQVKVKNADMESATSTVIINEPTAVTATFESIISPTCPGGSDGRFIVKAKGGNGGYSYSVDGSYFYTYAIIFENEGDHTVVVKDAKGCLSQEYTVNIPAVKANKIVVAGHTDITCSGQNTGRINVDVVSWAYDRVPKIVYSTFEANVYTNGSVLADNTPLVAGTYYVGAIDNYDCSYDADQDGTPDVIKVVIQEQAKLQITSAEASVQATCYGHPDGIISITATGGTAFVDGSHAQLWLSTSNVDVNLVNVNRFNDFSSYDDLTGISTTTVQVLKGIYYVYVKDNNCTITKWPFPIVVNGFDVVRITTPDVAAITHNKCSNDLMGAIVVAPATGGSGNLVYTLKKLDGSWNDVAGYVNVSSSTFNGLAGGTYKVVVTDQAGCTGDETAPIVINQPAPMDFNVDFTDLLLCNGSSDGLISVTGITGGTAPYNVTVLTETKTAIADAALFSGLTAGNYSVVVTDASGCSLTEEVEITQPEAITATLAKAEVSFTCPDAVDGVIEVAAVGGTGVYQYELLQDGVILVSYQAINSFPVPINHTYAVNVKDANGCIVSSNSLDVSPVLPIVPTLTDITCFGATKASLLVKATGEPGRTFSVRYKINNGNYPGTWTDLDINNELVINDLVFANSTPQQNFYYFQVKDSKGCVTEEIQKSFVPTQHPLKITAVQSTDQLSASFTITGGIPPYSYQVGNGVIVDFSADDDTYLVSDLKSPGSVVTIYDAHRCFVTKEFVVAPIAVSADPASGANQPNTFEVALTFSRPVTVAEGDITGGIVTPGTGTKFTVAMSGDDLATVSLVLGTGIMDAAGNTFAGQTFTYTIGDNTNPSLLSWTPLEVTLTNNDPTFLMTFNEDIALGAGGKMLIYKVGTTTPAMSIPLTDAMISGKTVTVTKIAAMGGLDKDTPYYVLVEGSALTDIAGNEFAGVSDMNVWTFITGPVFITDNEDLFHRTTNKVYPNPFVDYVDVESSSELSKVVVLNIAGQKVKEVINPSQRIELGDLKSGVYFLSMYNIDNVMVKSIKIVKK